MGSVIEKGMLIAVAVLFLLLIVGFVVDIFFDIGEQLNDLGKLLGWT